MNRSNSRITVFIVTILSLLIVSNNTKVSATDPQPPKGLPAEIWAKIIEETKQSLQTNVRTFSNVCKFFKSCAMPQYSKKKSISINAEIFSKVENIASLKDFQSIKIYLNHEGWTAEMFEKASQLQNITQIYYIKPTRLPQFYFSEFPKFKNLENLTIFTSDSLDQAQLNNFSGLKNLEILYLSMPKDQKLGPFDQFDFLKSLEKLKSFSLKTSISDENLNLLEPIIKKLSVLQNFKMILTDAQLKRLKEKFPEKEFASF